MMRASGLLAVSAALLAAAPAAAAAPLRAELHEGQLGAPVFVVAEGSAELPADPRAADLAQMIRAAHAVVTRGAPDYDAWPAWGTMRLIYALRVRPGGASACPADAAVKEAYAAIVDASGAVQDVYEDGDSFVSSFCSPNEAEFSIGGHEVGHGVVWRYLPLDGGDQVPGRDLETLALYESYADILGATLELAVDPYSDPEYCARHDCAAGALAPRAGCEDASGRWRIRIAGALARDMWRPSCDEALQPGPERADSPDYLCLGDASLPHVYHRNSLVHSRAYALFAEDVGLDAAFAVFMRALRDGTRDTTNFVEQAEHLRRACADLVGTELRDLASGGAIPPLDAAACARLDAALDAVGLTAPTRCGEERVPPAGCCSTHPPGAWDWLVVFMALGTGPFARRRRRA